MIDSKKAALTLFHRQQILEASKHLFEEKGFTKTSMDDIAKAAQYSKATLYVYFKSKDEIISYLTLESIQMLYNRLHKILTQENNFFACYKAICYELVSYQQTAPLYFDFSISNINIDIHNPNVPALYSDVYTLGEQVNEEIAHFLTTNITAGYLKEDLPILPTIFWLWGSLTGIIRMTHHKQDYITTTILPTKEAFLDYSFKMLLQSILKDGVKNAY